jgi:hypothetical protein
MAEDWLAEWEALSLSQCWVLLIVGVHLGIVKFLIGLLVLVA